MAKACWSRRENRSDGFSVGADPHASRRIGDWRPLEPLEPRMLLSGSILPEALAGSELPVAAADTTAAEVVARHLFYNNSVFDGSNPTANAADDVAIATDKQPLLPEQTATFANYSSYIKGINGIMVDVLGLAGTPTVDDFRLQVGNSDDSDAWPDYDGQFQVAQRDRAGVDRSDRITLTFPDQAIQGAWLKVTVLSDFAGGDLGLTENDVFYFGNAPGESGDNPANASVDATDELGARNNQHNFLNPAWVDVVYDYNRDARVDATDELIARNNQTNFLNRLDLFTAPKETFDWPSGDTLSSTYAVYVDGQPLDVFTYQDMDWVNIPWTEPIQVLVLRLDGQEITEHRVRPERLNVPSAAIESALVFSLDSPQNLVVSIDLLRKLVIVPQTVDPDRPDLTDATVVNVRDLGADPSGTTDNTALLQDAIDALPAGGTLYFPSGRYVTGSLRLKSDMTLYLDTHAVLRGSDDPQLHRFRSVTLYFLRIEDAANVNILGHGTIDANGAMARAAWQQIKGVDKVAGRALLAVNADHLTVRNVTIRESYSWNAHFVDCDNLHVDNVKVFSNMSQGNGDGLDLDGCHNVLVENCLIIAEDDAITPKSSAAWTDRSPRDYVIRDCVLWSQNATGIRLGAETFSTHFSNMLFENIDILRANTMIRIYNYDGAEIHNIVFRNIWAEEYSYYVQNLGYDEIQRGSVSTGETFFFFAYVRQRTASSPIGLIHDIRLEDVHSPRRVESRLDGRTPAGGGYSVYDVSFHNYWIDGDCYTTEGQLNISVRNAAESPSLTCD